MPVSSIHNLNATPLNRMVMPPDMLSNNLFFQLSLTTGISVFLQPGFQLQDGLADLYPST